MTATPREITVRTWSDQGSSEWSLKKFIEHLQAQYDAIDAKNQASAEFVIDDGVDRATTDLQPSAIYVRHTRTQTAEEAAAEAALDAEQAKIDEAYERSILADLKAKYPDAA